MALLDFCREVPPGDVVMFTDGFDTVLLQPKEIIVRKFLEFGGRGRIVISGESTDHRSAFFNRLFLMYHDCIFRTDLNTQWPKPLPYANRNVDLRRLNSGGIIGFAKDIVRVYSNADYSMNDQRYLSDIFLANPHKDITIDYNCAIFCLYTSDRDLKFLSFEEAEKQARHVVPSFPNEPPRAQPPAPSFARTALAGVLLDTRTNEVPCVLHMHCRRNADAITDRLGLPRGENLLNVRSYLWYAFFSVRGTVFNDRASGFKWALALLSTALSCISFIGLGLNLLAWGLKLAKETKSCSVLTGLVFNPILEKVGIATPVYIRSTYMGGGVRSQVFKSDDALRGGAEERVKGGGGEGQEHSRASLELGICDLLFVILCEILSVCTAAASWILDTAEGFRGIFAGGAVVGVGILVLMIHFLVGWSSRDDVLPVEEQESLEAEKAHNKQKKT